MAISCCKQNNFDIITVEVSVVDITNVIELKRELAPILAKAEQVILNLSKVSFIDSSGLSALLTCLRILESKQGCFLVAGVSSSVRGLIEQVRMHRIIELFDTLEQALQSTTA